MRRNKASESTNGQMEGNTQAGGDKVSNTVMESTLARMAKRNMGSGIMASDLSGSMPLRLRPLPLKSLQVGNKLLIELRGF